jgi:hypothetical protein
MKYIIEKEVNKYSGNDLITYHVYRKRLLHCNKFIKKFNNFTIAESHINDLFLEEHKLGGVMIINNNEYTFKPYSLPIA